MTRTRRYFSREFKVEAVRQALTSKRPLAAVARELGLGPDVLRRWRDELKARDGAPTDDRAGVTSDDEELRRLRRENAVLREEREILKKATAFFARETR